MAKILTPVSQASNFKVSAKANGEAEILIYGIVGGDSFFSDGISAKDFQKQLKELPANTKHITLRLNSPGGSVFDGWSIYNLLKQHPAKVTTYVDGMAASIASIIALAGDKIIMGEGAEMMIHQAWTFVGGNKRDMENMATRLYSLDDSLIAAYMKKTKKSKEEIQAALEAETWFNAEDAVDFGLADEKAEDTYAIAACIVGRANWIKKMPSNLFTDKEVVREKATNLQNEINAFLAKSKK